MSSKYSLTFSYIPCFVYSNMSFNRISLEILFISKIVGSINYYYVYLGII